MVECSLNAHWRLSVGSPLANPAFTSVKGAIQTNALSTNMDDQRSMSSCLVSGVSRQFSCLAAAHFDWIASLVFLVSSLKLNSTLSSNSASSYNHPVSSIRITVQECWVTAYFVLSVCLFLWKHDLMLHSCIDVMTVIDDVSLLLLSAFPSFVSLLCVFPRLPGFPLLVLFSHTPF